MLSMPLSPCCPYHPAEASRRVSQLRRSMLSSPGNRRLDLRILDFSRPPVGSLALRPGDLLTILKMALSIGFRSFSFLPSCYSSRVGGGALARWPPSAAQTARTVLPYAAFTKAHRWCDAREGINPTKLTSPYWLYSAAHGSCFQPLLRQRLHRCDQIRRTIQQSSRWKSFRT